MGVLGGEAARYVRNSHVSASMLIGFACGYATRQYLSLRRSTAARKKILRGTVDNAVQSEIKSPAALETTGA
jgi:hypothetical protein